jgi:hypothetical protein
VRVGAEVEIDIIFIRQAAAHGFADHGLIVYQQYHGGVFVGLEVVEL